MTGGGFLVARDASLFRFATIALKQLGVVHEASDPFGRAVTQLVDDEGRLFTIHDGLIEGFEWEAREGPFELVPGVQEPDMSTANVCPFECRWADLTVRVAREVAETAGYPTWLLDGNGVIWDAKSVDPVQLQL